MRVWTLRSNPTAFIASIRQAQGPAPRESGCMDRWLFKGARQLRRPPGKGVDNQQSVSELSYGYTCNM
eukprot:6490277-Amphidinium_carterae.3